MSASPQKKLRVLFVDDEEAIRSVMKIELPHMGHDVTLCASGEEAIQAIDKNTFDAAILDLRMPGLSGEGLHDKLRTMEESLPVVIITGHGGAQSRTAVPGSELRIYPELRHEILNEPEWESVLGDLFGWLGRREQGSEGMG